MPPNKARINITPTPKLNETVTRLAELQNTTKARICADMLNQAEPQLSKLANILEMARKGKKVAAEKSIRQMLSEGLQALAHLDDEATWEERFQNDPDATDANWRAYRYRITGA